MNIEECDSHSSDHREDNYTDHKSCDKEHRAAELAEYRQHQCHIAAEAEYGRIIIHQYREIHHLIQSVNKEHHSKEESERQNQERNTSSPEMLRKQESVKHNNSINHPLLPSPNSLPFPPTRSTRRTSAVPLTSARYRRYRSSDGTRSERSETGVPLKGDVTK